MGRMKFFLCVVLIFVFAAAAFGMDEDTGFITGDNVNVRAAPDLKAKVQVQLFKGDEVRSLNEFYWKEDKPDERVWHLVEVVTVKGKPLKAKIRGWIDCTFIDYPAGGD